MHQPSKIPAELWQVFRQVDDMKETITNSNKGDIKAELQGIDANTYIRTYAYIRMHTYVRTCVYIHACTNYACLR